MRDEILDAQEVTALKQQVMLFSEVIESWKIQEYLNTIARCNAIGPMIDPTGWMQHHRSWEPMERILKPLLAFQQEAKAVRAELIAEREEA